MNRGDGGFGLGVSGAFLNDLYSLAAPAAVVWADTGGLAALIRIYDWDTIELGPNVTMVLPGRVDLCTGLYPCYISVVGASGGGGRIYRAGNSSLHCDAAAGCIGIALHSVRVECGGRVSAGALVRMMAGAELRLSNMSFQGCASSSDGAAILAFASNVMVTDSAFNGLWTAGDGGAISIVGGTLTVLRSHFRGCTAAGAGGAISASAFLCSGAIGVTYTAVDIENTVFEGCSAGRTGGGLAASSALVQVKVLGSIAEGCTAGEVGGAFFAEDQAQMSLRQTWLVANSAGGGGGGGVHASNSQLVLHGVAGIGNAAHAGGGGVIYWQGSHPAVIVDWCSAGTWAAASSSCTSPACRPLCTQCSAGTFQSAQAATACTLCAEGTYSTALGATSVDACSSCPAGTNSSYAGAKSPAACVPCPVGAFAIVGATECVPCPSGWFSDTLGAATCVPCGTGLFSTVVGASSERTCVACPTGSYSTSTAASACSLCPAGSYSDAVRAKSAAVCIACGAGLYSSAAGAVDAGACTACGAGKFAPRKSYSYSIVRNSWDDAEAACVAAGGHLASVDSAAERNQILGILVQGMDWWIGLRFSTATGAWTWVENGKAAAWDGWGDANPKSSGGMVSHGCAVMPSYPYSTDSSGSLDVQWPFFVAEFDVVLSSAYFNSDPGAWYNIECADRRGWINGHICSYTGASACLTCSPGAYSSAPAATECRACAAGAYTSLAGSTACKLCVPGNFSKLEGTLVCDAGTGVWVNSTSRRTLDSVPATRKMQQPVAR